jgi:hypothetical protein
MRHAIRCLTIAVLALTLAAPAAAKTFKMKTTVKDFVTTKWTLDCPTGGKIDLTKVALDDAGTDLFYECLGDIESMNGIEISSRTKVKGFVTQQDTIKSTTEMSEEQAQKLCDIIAMHRIPEVPFATGRRRIQTVTCNGAIESIIVDLGDGRKVDLVNGMLTAQQLQALLDLLDQFAQQNGIHVAGQTTSDEGGVQKDRVLAVTYLEDGQIDQFLQTAQNEGVGIPLAVTVFPAGAKGVLRIDGEKLKVELEGPFVVKRNPPVVAPGGGVTIPIEIVQLELVGVDPVFPGNDVVIRLPAGPPAQGTLQSSDTKPEKFELEIPIPLEVERGGTTFGVPAPVPATGKIKTPVTKDPKVKIKGEHELRDPGDAPRGTLKLGTIKLDAPGQLPLVPLGP